MNTSQQQPRPEDFRISVEVAVRFRDIDAMGHVNNAVFATYFEVARSHYLMSLGLGEVGTSDLAERLPFILLDLYCRFVSPVRMDDRLRVHIRASRLGTTSWDFEYLITAEHDGRTVAVGRSTQVYYDYSARQTAPVPEGMREAIIARDGPEIG
jgi:acyl-CoA thioester hydrolase